MTAGINASIHFSIDDGWHAEFQKDGINSFTISHADPSLFNDEIDRLKSFNHIQELFLYNIQTF